MRSMLSVRVTVTAGDELTGSTTMSASSRTSERSSVASTTPAALPSFVQVSV